MEQVYPGSMLLDQYEVLRVMRGGMGIVYMCLDSERQVPLALKTYRPEFLASREARERFLREAAVWIDLGSHPHIVRAFSVLKYTSDPEIYLSMEWIEKAEGLRDASLRSLMTSAGGIEIGLALNISLQIARGMIHATSRVPGLVHRDLKPENILLGQDGYAHVTDFGLVSVPESSALNAPQKMSYGLGVRGPGMTRGWVGTPHYMSPEQFSNEEIDLRADIYSFGCVLFEMLTGTPAVSGRDWNDLMQAHTAGAGWIAAERIQSPLREVLVKCLAPGMGERYQSWGEVEAALAGLWDSILQQVPPEPFPTEASVNDPNHAFDETSKGLSYNAIGMSYVEIGKPELAANFFEKGLHIARMHGPIELEIMSTSNLGLALHELGELGQAQELLENALSTIRKQGSSVVPESRVLLVLGRVLDAKGWIQNAQSHYEAALSISCEKKDSEVEAFALLELGRLNLNQGQVQEALAKGTLALNIANRIGITRLNEGACNLRGQAFEFMGDLTQAGRCYEDGLRKAKEIGHDHGEAQSLMQLGRFWINQGNPGRGFEYLKLSMEKFSLLGVRNPELLAEIGKCRRQQGDIEGSIKYCNEALMVARERLDKRAEEWALRSLGVSLRLKGDLSGAIKYGQAALDLARSRGNKTGEANYLNNLGVAYRNAGDYSNAATHYSQSLLITRMLGDRQLEADVLDNFARCCLSVSDLESAMLFQEQALIIWIDRHHTANIAIACFYLANITYLQGNSSKALDYAHRATDHFSRADRTRDVLFCMAENIKLIAAIETGG